MTSWPHVPRHLPCHTSPAPPPLPPPLQDGVEENNWLQHNLGAYVHTIGNPAGGVTQSGELFVEVGNWGGGHGMWGAEGQSSTSACELDERVVCLGCLARRRGHLAVCGGGSGWGQVCCSGNVSVECQRGRISLQCGSRVPVPRTVTYTSHSSPPSPARTPTWRTPRTQPPPSSTPPTPTTHSRWAGAWRLLPDCSTAALLWHVWDAYGSCCGALWMLKRLSHSLPAGQRRKRGLCRLQLPSAARAHWGKSGVTCRRVIRTCIAALLGSSKRATQDA